MPLSPLINDLVSKQMSPLNALFTEAGARPPVVIWDPGHAALSQPLLQRFSHVAQKLANPDGTINIQTLDMREFGDLGDWMLHVRFADELDTLHYEHCGAGIASIRGPNLLGIALEDSDHPQPEPHVDAFLKAVYRAISNVRKPVLAEHQPPTNEFIRQWCRLIFPLTDGHSDQTAPKPICGCICLAYADNELSPGLESLADPVIVMDADHRVMFSNRQARELFNGGQFGPWGRNIFDFAGLQLSISETPRSMYESGQVLTFKTRHLAHALLSYVVIRVSSLRHNGHFYFLLVVRCED